MWVLKHSEMFIFSNKLLCWKKISLYVILCERLSNYVFTYIFGLPSSLPVFLSLSPFFSHFSTPIFCIPFFFSLSFKCSLRTALSPGTGSGTVEWLHRIIYYVLGIVEQSAGLLSGLVGSEEVVKFWSGWLFLLISSRSDEYCSRGRS